MSLNACDPSLYGDPPDPDDLDLIYRRPTDKVVSSDATMVTFYYIAAPAETTSLTLTLLPSNTENVPVPNAPLLSVMYTMAVPSGEARVFLQETMNLTSVVDPVAVTITRTGQ